MRSPLEHATWVAPEVSTIELPVLRSATAYEDNVKGNLPQ